MKDMDIKRKKLDSSFKLGKKPDQDSNEVSDSKGQDQTKLLKLVHYKKEKSRNAARTRRGKENYEFYELARLLPISSDTSSQLDKASIVRLTMSHLQLQLFLHANYRLDASQSQVHQKEKSSLQPNPAELTLKAQQYIENNLGSMILQSLDGFLFVLNEDGRFLYVSNAVNVCLGLAQVDLVGTSIYNYIHPSDHQEVRDAFCHKNPASSNVHFSKIDNNSESKMHTDDRSFFVRMRSTLSRRGMNVKSTGYKVVHVTGKNRSRGSVTKLGSGEKDESYDLKGFVGVGHILPPPSLTDVQSDIPLFIARLDPSLTVNYCEERVKAYVSFNANEVKGQSLYHFIHSLDIYKISECHKQALSKGQVVTPYYRWVLKNGSCVWMQSYVTMLADRQPDVEDTFVWVNYILGSEPNLFTSSLITSENPEALNTSGKGDEELLKSPVKAIEKQFSNKTLKNEIDEAPTTSPKKLKIIVSDQSFCTANKDHKSTKNKKDNSLEKRNSEDRSMCKKLQTVAQNGSSSLPRTTANILDDHSKIWLNPPNKEVSNHSDLPPGANVLKCHATDTVFSAQQIPSVIHHHYPLGINPNLLHANPVLAKMLAPGFVPEAYLSSNKAIIFAAPMVKFMSPVFAPVPTHSQILPAPNNMECCPTSIADIIDELRKDPMRKVSPPNKVVLPNVIDVSHCNETTSEIGNSVDDTTKMAIPSQNIAPFSLQYCTNEEYILGNLRTPFVFQPITISRKFNSFSV
uniref:Trh n=1 Tax=Phallusia mammillata TaxID=59560 RepID=A0A6F9DUW7_9ASCI|nr:Trh [Phallusia mammillata]